MLNVFLQVCNLCPHGHLLMVCWPAQHYFQWVRSDHAWPPPYIDWLSCQGQSEYFRIKVDEGGSVLCFVALIPEEDHAVVVVLAQELLVPGQHFQLSVQSSCVSLAL